MSQDMVPLGWLHSERKAKEDLKQALSEAEARNLEQATELENVTKKVDELKESLQRLEEKLSNSESENQAFQTQLEEANAQQQEALQAMRLEVEEAKAQENAKQQEALQAMRLEVEEAKAARKAIEEAPPVIKEIPVLVEDTEKINSLTSEVEALKASLQSERDAADNLKKAFSEAEARNSKLATELETATRKADQLLKELEEKAHKSLNEKQQELLVKCISENLGYDGGKPVAACVIYRCLLHWKSFGEETTTVFDCIIKVIGSAVEDPNNNEILAYWLSNSAILLWLLERTLRLTGSSSLERQNQRSSTSSLFGRMAMSFRSSPGVPFVRQAVTKHNDLRLVEAKYPALLFKQQLTAYLEKIYEMIRDNLKKEISPLLGLCIQATRNSRASLVKGRAQANAAAQQAPIAHWQSIRKSLNSCLNLMKANNAPPVIVRKVFTQVFFFINVQLFNSVLLRSECCSFSNGEYIKAGLDELEQWCVEATEEYAGSACDELIHIRQAVGFLVFHQKPEKTLDKITTQLCPVLSIQQIYRISTMYWDDNYGTHSVSSYVLANMRVMMDEDSDSDVSSSFLLCDDLSIPFSADELSESVKQVDVYDNEPPQLLRQNSGFGFLFPRGEDSPS